MIRGRNVSKTSKERTNLCLNRNSFAEFLMSKYLADDVRG